MPAITDPTREALLGKEELIDELSWHLADHGASIDGSFINFRRILSRISVRQRQLKIALCIITLCLILIASVQHKSVLLVRAPRDDILDVFNSTLGFQKVYAIGLPDRTDKRDAITLASSLTGFDVEWIDGVAFEDISPKTIPAKWNLQRLSKGALGCWRAHMNVMRKIVAERIQSALVFEDDSDWDVYLKDQLFGIAQGMRALTAQAEPYRSPYGDQWDFLWTGQCAIGPSTATRKFYVFENDTTVQPLRIRHGSWRNWHVPDEVFQNNTRLLFRADRGVCSYSYAVTYESARRILAALSLKSISSEVDIEWMKMCSQNDRYTKPFICYGVYPPITSSHRFAGSHQRDSDIESFSNQWHGDYSYDIVYSAIRNAGRMAAGEDTVLAQWPDFALEKETDWRKHRPVNGTVRDINLREYGTSKFGRINA